MSSPIALTPEQLKFFDTFGYLGFPGLLADRADAIIEAFETVWTGRGGGHNGQPHDGIRRSCIVPFIDQSAYLCSLLDDPRIEGIATSLMGDDFNYMGSDGNYYAGDTPWHSDGWHKELRHVKIAFYLDPLTRDTGALRVIPGSHQIQDAYANALQEKVRKSEDLWGVTGSQIPAVAHETNPGDVVCFNHNTKHAAFGGGARRRMFTINLCQRYPEERLPDLRRYLEGFSRFWVDRAYSDIMIGTAGPSRMRHLEQVMANDDHIAALSAKAQETMPEPSRG
ncbi:MAG: phytanoyl-CoA dioxygenase family protein [candidate division Zixibacteria bacterium]|nr:phytanoyl-CoA dioxygenase family protein [candidate division Zixibacteria bacterium]